MAVTIDINLKSGSAATKIGAIATELEALDKAAGDLDLDFDQDLEDIGGQLDDMAETLANVELDFGKLDTRIREAAEEIDGSKVHVIGPSGRTNAGDSTGDDPPQTINIKPADLPDYSDLRDAATDDDGSSPIDTGIGDSDRNLKNAVKNVGENLGLNIESIEDIGPRRNISDELFEKDINELRSMASDRGLYGDDKNLGRSELVPRIRSDIAKDEPLRNRRFRIETEDYGVLSGQSIMDEAKVGGSFPDVPDVTDEDGPRSNSIFASISEKIKKFKPSMKMYRSLFAALLPVLAALGTQLLGVAAAMGSVAVAGGAIMGLGLLGHGSDMASSMEGAKEQLSDLKTELFNVVQPLAQLFAPIQARMFDAIPGSLTGIVDEMRGLTQFEGTLFSLGSGLVGGVEEFFAIINRNATTISELSTQFGSLIGGGILNFFEFLIQSAGRNTTLIRELGGVVKNVFIILYNLFMLVGRMVSSLKGLSDLLTTISGILNNPVVAGIATTVVMFTIMTAAVWKLVTAIAVMNGALSTFAGGTLLARIGSAIAYYTGQIWGMTTALWSAVFASTALVAALSALTLGAFAVGAGYAGMKAMETFKPNSSANSVGSGGVGTIINDNRSYEINNRGSMDTAQEERLNDTIADFHREESATAAPNPTTGSSTSNEDQYGNQR
jgi:hypothetical protein